MKASFVSMILFLSRAWDAVSDPLVGYLVGLSPWTPVGKLTPWSVVEGTLVFWVPCVWMSGDAGSRSRRLILSTPLGVLSYLLLWFVPRGWTSPAASALWFLAVTCLFETLMSVSSAQLYYLLVYQCWFECVNRYLVATMCISISSLTCKNCYMHTKPPKITCSSNLS